MGRGADDSLRGVARFRCGPGLVCVLAYAATAGPAPPRATTPDSALKIEKSAASQVIYFEESGGLITPVAKPPPGSAREPLPPFPARAAKASRPRPPVARTEPAAASKTRFGKAPPAPRTPATEAPAPPVPVSVAKSEEDLRRDQRREYDALVASLTAENASPAERARRIDEAAGRLIVSYRDVTMAVRLGWDWLNGKDPASAALWFQRARAWRAGDEEATRGLAIATLAERNYTAALALTDELPSNSPVRADVRREAWIGIGQGEYRFERFAGAIDAFDRAAATGELPRHARMLRAWSRLKVGDKAAATDFALLYRESPDIESAQGIIAAVPTGPLPIDAVVASTEPLASLLRARAGEAAFRSGRYLEARALDPTRWSSLGSPGVISALTGVGRRERTGEAGLGKLAADFLPGADISIPVGERAVITASTSRVRLNAGERGSGAPVGMEPTDRLRFAPPVLVRATVRESKLNFRMERDIAIIASVGSGVLGGAVDARPVGSVEVSASPGWGKAEARAFVEPVRESILSWSGMADPHGGSAWGGVRRLGAETRVLYLGYAPYSLGFHARVERLAGTLVASNDHRAFDASAGRDFGLPGFAYSSLGLAVSDDVYRRNLSHYTTGHGGYFSPQSHRKAGVAFDFMTEEGKRWIVRGRANAARVWKREDAAPFFPLQPEGRTYEGSRSRGYEGSIRVSSVAQLSPRVQVGVAFGRSISPQFSERLVQLEVRVLIDPRRGVVSADLPVVRGE